MAGIAVDTPDYQRGVVSTQKLLAAVEAGTYSVKVGVPPNAESLVVVFGAANDAFSVSCVGATTGTAYPGTFVPSGPFVQSYVQYIFSASASLDSEVTITADAIFGGKWWVYADTAVHTFHNSALQDSAEYSYGSGRLRVREVGPSATTGVVRFTAGAQASQLLGVSSAPGNSIYRCQVLPYTSGQLPSFGVYVGGTTTGDQILGGTLVNNAGAFFDLGGYETTEEVYGYAATYDAYIVLFYRPPA